MSLNAKIMVIPVVIIVMQLLIIMIVIIIIAYKWMHCLIDTNCTVMLVVNM